MSDPTLVEANPFPGLQPFTEDHAPYFFGRERDRRIIVASTFAGPVTVLHGVSGVGKSSLVNVGVVPDLARRDRIEVVRVGDWHGGALDRLKDTIAAVRPGQLDPELELPELLERASADQRIVVVLDQFEDALRYQDESTSPLLGELAAAIDDEAVDANLLFVLRSEAVVRLRFLEWTGIDLLQSMLVVEPLERADAEQAIRGPIEAVGEELGLVTSVEDGVVDAVLDYVEGRSAAQFRAGGAGLSDVLAGGDRSGFETPLLQLIMRELWSLEVADGPDRPRTPGAVHLRTQTLEDRGGADSIVRFHVEAVLDSLTPETQALVASLLDKLCLADTKVARSAAELAHSTRQPVEQVDELLGLLSSGETRLLRSAPSGRDEPVFELVSDRLVEFVRGWIRRQRNSPVSAETEAAVLASGLGDTGTRSRSIGRPARRSTPDPGRALCLSGGGYRAMLFHVGALWRLNELGMMRTLRRVSSVSTGSITAAALGQSWGDLAFDRNGVAGGFDQHVVAPLRHLASTNIDVRAVLVGLLTPGSAGSKLMDHLERHLFAGRTLQDLPADDDGPRFVVNATNVATAGLWQFSRPFMGEWSIGLVRTPTVSLAHAVAASAAFAPVLSPVRMDVPADAYEAESPPPPNAGLRGETVTLTDGGVYDNLALETAWKRYRTILVSDAGGALPVGAKQPGDWLRHTVRVLTVTDRQVRSLRKRQLLEGFETGDRDGAYWSVHSSLSDSGVADPVPVDPAIADEIASTPARMAKLPDRVQEELINWGYASADTSLRRWVVPDAPRPTQLPYPKRPLTRRG